MQKIIITGNLCDKPELRGTGDGRKVCNFVVAVNRPLRAGQERREADFFRVSAWNKKADACMDYLDKGSKVRIDGTVSAHAYIDRNGDPRAVIDLLAEDVEFLGRPTGSYVSGEAAYRQQEREAIQQENRPTSGRDQQSGFEAVAGDDLPF